MVITICDSCAPSFAAKVEQTIQGLPLLTCGATDCPDCESVRDRMKDPWILAHYSRNGVLDWRRLQEGNGLNWSSFVCDSVSAVDRMTEQPGRIYKQLCLIKFARCKNLYTRQESFNLGHHAVHIGLHFSVPAAFIGRLTLVHSSSPQAMYTIA